MRTLLPFMWLFVLCGVSRAAEAAAQAALAESESRWLAYWERRTEELLGLVSAQPHDTASVWSFAMARVFELGTAELRRPAVNVCAVRIRLESSPSPANVAATADEAGWLYLKAAALLQHAEAELFAMERAVNVHGAHVEMLHAMLVAGAHRFGAEDGAQAWADACVSLLVRLRASIEQALASKAHFLSVECALQRYRQLYIDLGGRAWLGGTEAGPLAMGKRHARNTSFVSGLVSSTTTKTTQSPQVVDLTGDGPLVKTQPLPGITTTGQTQSCTSSSPDLHQSSEAGRASSTTALNSTPSSSYAPSGSGKTAERAVSAPCIAYSNETSRGNAASVTTAPRTMSDGSILAPPSQLMSDTQPPDCTESARQTPSRIAEEHPETTQELFSGVRRHAEATSFFLNASATYVSALIGCHYASLVAFLSGTPISDAFLQERLEGAAGAVQMAQASLGLAEGALVAAGAVQTSSNIQRAAKTCIKRPASNADVSRAIHSVSLRMIATIGSAAVQASTQACHVLQILLSHTRSLEAAQTSYANALLALYTTPPGAVTAMHLLGFAQAAAQLAMRHVAVQYTVARESLARANAIRQERAVQVLYTAASKFSA